MSDNQIIDSGERTEFASGAVRDMHEGKGDMASVPWESILRLSKHYEYGAKKICSLELPQRHPGILVHRFSLQTHRKIPMWL